MLDGFTGDQRFFIGWAQIWARKFREEELRRRLLTDPHSPTEYRVNGIVRNMPQFDVGVRREARATSCTCRRTSGSRSGDLT